MNAMLPATVVISTRTARIFPVCRHTCCPLWFNDYLSSGGIFQNWLRSKLPRGKQFPVSISFLIQ